MKETIRAAIKLPNDYNVRAIYVEVSLLTFEQSVVKLEERLPGVLPF